MASIACPAFTLACSASSRGPEPAMGGGEVLGHGSSSGGLQLGECGSQCRGTVYALFLELVQGISETVCGGLDVLGVLPRPRSRFWRCGYVGL